MADETAPASVPAVPTPPAADAGAGATKVPLHELLNERGKRQTAETELATLRPLAETYKQQLEQAQAAAAAAQEKAAAYEAREKAERETLIGALPEADRPIAQAIQDPAALAAFAARVGKPPAPTVPVVAGPAGGAGNPSKLTPDDIRKGVREGGLAWFRENVGKP